MKNRAWTGLGSVAVWCTIVAVSPHATAQTLPNYGYEWATITHPGNRAPIPEVMRFNRTFSYGSVGYTYRMAKTEVTIGDWLEFLNAYEPFIQGDPHNSERTGFWIVYSPSTRTFIPREPGIENRPVTSSWRTAARYTNWLHNDKLNEAWAFEIGAYDTSTFTQNPNESYNDQLTRSPGARFWIPSYDEWIKAAHYDPNRYGVGEEGYWLFPDGGQQALVSGLPGEGGETDAGFFFPPEVRLDTAQYPHVQSPWGLLDVSGGVAEWNEVFIDRRHRGMAKSERRRLLAFDELGEGLTFHPPIAPFFGVRIASIPSPGAGMFLAPAFTLCVLTRRRVQ